MKKTLLLSTFCVLVALSAQANLVINGGFETGAFPPWVPGNAVITSVAANVHSGAKAAQLNPTVSAITQVVPIVGGNTYYLDFWAKASGVGVLTVTLDSLLVAAFAPSLTYTHYIFGALTPLSSGNLTFSWADNSSHSAFIDDVNLVPEPTTMIA